MLDISRAGVDRSNTVVCLENGASEEETSSINSINRHITSTVSRRHYSSRPTSAEELREYAHKLCRDYLRGAWLSILSKDMIFTKVSGGLSNLLYYCALPDSVETSGTEPRRLLLRLYGNVNSEKAIENLITESVIFALLSETQRGPRLYGVFSGGRLEEYIEARPLQTIELSNSVMSALIADKMAQIHLMDVPINKQPIWLWQTMLGWIEQIENLMASGNISQSYKDMFNSVQKFELKKEFIWLKEYLISMKSPVVFCHNDLQEGNILLRNSSSPADSSNNNNITSNNDNNINKHLKTNPLTSCCLKTESAVNNEDDKKSATTVTITSAEIQLPNNLTSDDLVVIDFEYCSYNYRAFDFANHFCEWIYDYSNQAEPYFWCIETNRPTDEQKAHFIKNYLKSLAVYPEYKTNEEDSLERIMREVNAFILASHFFWGLWSVINTTTSDITFDYWSYGKCRFNAYYKHKEEMIGKVEKEKN